MHTVISTKLTRPMLLLILVLVFFNFPILAQSSTRPQPPPNSNKSPSEPSDQSKEAPEEPVARADNLKSKLTLGIYFTPGARVYDLNLRHQFGPLTA
jgi:hypothetical protein